MTTVISFRFPRSGSSCSAHDGHDEAFGVWSAVLGGISGNSTIRFGIGGSGLGYFGVYKLQLMTPNSS
jgi:hypothetical protein